MEKGTDLPDCQYPFLSESVVLLLKVNQQNILAEKEISAH